MKYSINEENVLITELGQEGVLFEIESNKYVSLNETLFKIMKGIEQGLEIEQIIQQLCNEYAITEETCRADVAEAIAFLLKEKYII
jgi:hypothetical protein